jgi:SecD/SecF fusion protein
VTSPDGAGEQVSAAEFQEMVRDLGIAGAEAQTRGMTVEPAEFSAPAEPTNRAERRAAARKPSGSTPSQPPAAPPATPPADEPDAPAGPVQRAADLSPEEVTFRDDPVKRSKPSRGPKKRRR